VQETPRDVAIGITHLSGYRRAYTPRTMSTQGFIGAWLLAAATLSAAPQNGSPLPPIKDPKDERPWPDATQLTAARRAAEARPLFASAEPLALSIVADWGQVQRDRDPDGEKTYSATIVIAQGKPEEQRIAANIRTRGHSRLRPEFCSFAPLRIDFATNPAGTVFDGQKRLKLGTHCRDIGDYPEYTVREYPVYRMFNTLTSSSFRARLAEVQYVDAKSAKAFVRGGLFLEDDDDLARRMGGRISESRGTPGQGLDFGMVALTTMFQYMIGNTDVSIKSLHNIRVVLMPDGKRYPVPYDFDFSGVVNARYAQPNPLLTMLSSVRERLYLGPCIPLPVLNVYVDRLHAKREMLLGVYDSVPMLEPKSRTAAKDYLAGFFSRTATPAGVKRAFVDNCGTRPFM
jgi:hypothetical protein